MNKTTAIIIGVVAFLLIGNGIYAFMNNRGGVMTDQEDQMMPDDSTVMSGENADMMDDGGVKLNAGSYEAYAPEKLARAESGDVVIFFHASWCPTCRALSADIEKNLTAIPDGVSILKVDYDTETALKKKYSITYQHTLVQVDASGTLIKKWSGSPTLDRLVSEIK